MSLLHRVMLLVLLALLPAVGIELYNQIELHRSREAEIRQQAARLVNLIEAEHARLVEGIRQVLVTLAQTRSLREFDADACRGLMQRLRSQYPDYMTVHVTDRDGVIRCAGDDAALGIPVGDRTYWKGAMENGGFAVGNYIRERASDTPVLPFGFAYRTLREEVAGVVSVLLDTRWLEQYLARKPLPNGAALTIADRNGVVLARVPEIPGMVGRPLPDTYTPLLKAEQHGEAELPGLDGVHRLLAYSPVTSDVTPLFIAVGLDKNVALAPLNAAMWRAVVLTAAVMVGTLLLAWWGGHRYVRRPIDTLVRATQRWSEGDLAVRSGLAEGRSEFGVLGRAFDRMVDAVQQQSRAREDALAATLQAQALLDRVMETMPVGVVIIAMDGRILRLNPAAERIWAGRREVGIEHYGEYRGWRVETGKRLEARDWAAARAIESGETSLDEVIDIQCFDGTRKTILNSAIPLLDADRRITGAVVTLEDITERRAAEQALRASEERLRESEARYRAIVDTAVDAFVVIDKQGIILSFNQAAERIFGYSAVEVIGQNVAMLMPEPHRVRHDGYLANYHQTGQRKIIGIGREVEGRRKDGSTFPLELSIAEWEVTAGRFFTGIMRDVTARRESERALQESYNLLNTIIEGIPDPVYAKDLQGRYILVNAHALRVMGVERETGFGATDRTLFPPEVAAHVETSDQQILKSGERLVLEEEIGGPMEDRHLFLTTKAPLRSPSGQIIGLVGISRDITDLKRVEDSLRTAMTEAERANLAKSKFLAAASHDLRQPVQSLMLFMEVSKGLLTDHPAASTLARMEQSLDALRLLLDSLLDVSKLDAGLVVAQPIAMPLLPLLERLRNEYGPRAEARGLAFRTVWTAAVVYSDPGLLERMLRNLIENALRYTEHGGVLVGCRRRGGHALIEVVDTGVGVAPERHEEIFEEFFQVGNPERDRAKGLGLGLAVVRRLGCLLGHEVDVRSRPGHGSIFTIKASMVAAVEPLPAAVHQDNEPVGDGHTGLILVVDDEALIRMGLKAMLEGWDHRVLVAESVAEAVRCAEQHGRPDCIIADYRLRNGETGHDVIRAVHARFDPSIPATIITGDTAPERLTEAHAGGFLLIHKPVATSDLRRGVARMLAEAKGRRRA